MYENNIHSNRIERAPSETAPPWSVDKALDDLWSGFLTAAGTSDQIRAYIRSHLEKAFTAGVVTSYTNR